MHRKITATILFLSSIVTSLVLIIGWTGERPSTTAAVTSAVSKSFLLLQTSGAKFIATSRCASCHHNSLTSMIAEKLPAKGFSALDTTLQMRRFAALGTIHFVGNPNMVKQFVSAKFLTPYQLMGLNRRRSGFKFRYRHSGGLPAWTGAA